MVTSAVVSFGDEGGGGLGGGSGSGMCGGDGCNGGNGISGGGAEGGEQLPHTALKAVLATAACGYEVSCSYQTRMPLPLCTT